MVLQTLNYNINEMMMKMVYSYLNPLLSISNIKVMFTKHDPPNAIAGTVSGSENLPVADETSSTEWSFV